MASGIYSITSCVSQTAIGIGNGSTWTDAYTTLSGAIIGILSSGLANPGYNEYNYTLLVDNSLYNEPFDIIVPESGTFNIIGGYLPESTTKYKGKIQLNNTSTLSMHPYNVDSIVLENFDIDCSNSENYIFETHDDTNLILKDITFINCNYGINSSGNIVLDNVSSCGNSSGIFLTSIGETEISHTSISRYNIGIQGTELIISNCKLHDNTIDISYNGSITDSNSLYYGSTYGILGSGTLSLTHNTINALNPVTISGGYLTCDYSILQSSGEYCIQGDPASGSLINYTILNPSGWDTSLDDYIVTTSILYSDPLFYDSNNNDYNLQFKQTTGSPGVAIEQYVPDDITVKLENAGFLVKYDTDKFKLEWNKYNTLVYKQNNTLLFSDYEKEDILANILHNLNYPELSYDINYILSFSNYEILLNSAFNTASGTYDSWPYDWDYVEINTTEIGPDYKYIIPRSILDFKQIVMDRFESIGWGGTFDNEHTRFNRNNITPYVQIDYRGITYDVDNSYPGVGVGWLIEGRNQKLIKRNLYTGENIIEYPLLLPTPDNYKPYIRPSGLIPVGVQNNDYLFRRPTEDIEIHALTENGDCQYLDTTLNSQCDLRGIYSYKNNLYITGSEYPYTLTTRSGIITSEIADGIVLRYNSNDIFPYYTTSLTGSGYPDKFYLVSGNYYPTDLTVYEDGTFLVADYISGIYSYIPKYDYAIIESRADRETMLLFREQYNDIDL